MHHPFTRGLIVYIIIYLLIGYGDYIIVTTQPDPILAIISSIMLGTGAVLAPITRAIEVLSLFAVVSAIPLLIALSLLVAMP